MTNGSWNEKIGDREMGNDVEDGGGRKGVRGARAGNPKNPALFLKIHRYTAPPFAERASASVSKKYYYTMN